MLELLFLLLPIAAAYGYYMGRQSIKNKNQEDKNKKSNNYIQGVEYLLDNQNDRAVDKFIDYFTQSDPTFETQLALGNLFRKRGEVDKAISLHRELSVRADVDVIENELSLLELAKDFLSAGLIDRAEEILDKLIQIPRQRYDSALLLIDLYEQEREFLKAVEICNEYMDILPSNIKIKLANYYCELAFISVLNNDENQALSFYQKALHVNKKSIRAHLALADIYVKENNLIKAFDLIKAACAIEPDYGILYLDIIRKCFPNKADQKLRIALEDLVRLTKSSEVMVELVEIINNTSGRQQADQLLLNALSFKGNLKLFSSLMGQRAKEMSTDVASQTILQLKSLVDRQIAANYKFCCTKCGFESKIMFWQCPSCRCWDSIKPKRGLDGD